MRTAARMGRGCLGEILLGAGAGRGRVGGGVCRLARSRFVRSRRVCVRALRVCVLSQFPPSAALPDSGERAVPLLRVRCPFLPSLLLLPFRADSVFPAGLSGAPVSQAQVSRAQRASELSRFPQVPFPPYPPRPVRPAHSAFTLLEFAPLLLNLPLPLVAPLSSLVLHLGLPRAFLL